MSTANIPTEKQQSSTARAYKKSPVVLPRKNGHSYGCACRNTGIHHVGLHAKDPSASAEFYPDLSACRSWEGAGRSIRLEPAPFYAADLTQPDEALLGRSLFMGEVI
jgi:hypothetical protein